MLISSIQTAAQAFYDPISQRITQIIQTADWKEKTMLAGLIISVCCAVVTFFTQATVICGAFTLLSAVCGLGGIYMRSYENLKKMEEQIKKLEEENQRFQANNQALQSQVAIHKDSVTQLTFENEKLQSEVTKLAIHTGFLKNTSQELIHSVEELQVNLVVLGPSVLRSQEVEKNLHAFSITMEKQQTVTKNLMQLVSQVSVEHSDQLENQKEIVKQLQLLQKTDTTLQKIKEWNFLTEQISCSHDRLADVLIKATQTSTELSNLQSQLSTLREQYGLENTRLQETRQELSEVASALQFVLAEQKDDRATLVSQIDRLQKLYAELNWNHSDRINNLA